jgi:hypothetical protein
VQAAKEEREKERKKRELVDVVVVVEGIIMGRAFLLSYERYPHFAPRNATIFSWPLPAPLGSMCHTHIIH